MANETGGGEGPIAETKQRRSWRIKRYTSENAKPGVTHVPKSAHVPGFGATKASSRSCPSCGFLPFGWSKECSKCGHVLEEE